MRHLLIGVTAAATIAVIGPASAQVLPNGAPQPSPPAVYAAQRYPFPDVTPEDAYRNGLINRWQLEQYGRANSAGAKRAERGWRQPLGQWRRHVDRAAPLQP